MQKYCGKAQQSELNQRYRQTTEVIPMPIVERNVVTSGKENSRDEVTAPNRKRAVNSKLLRCVGACIVNGLS